MDQDLVSLGAQNIGHRHHAAQDSVDIADVLRLQPLYPVAAALPGNDAVKVFLPGAEIAEQRVLQPLGHALHHRRHRGKIHVRHPHGDQVEALTGRVPGPQVGVLEVHRLSVHTVAVNDRCEIVFHVVSPLFLFMTLSWERVAGRSPDGCGAVQRPALRRPSSAACGRHLPPGEGRDFSHPTSFVSFSRDRIRKVSL